MATIKDLMNCDVQTIGMDEPLSLAAQRMSQHSIRHLVVTDEMQVPKGVISERDVLRYLVRSLNQRNKRPVDATSSSLVAKEMLCVQPDSPISKAASVMAEQKIGCVPVVNADGNLVGIVSAVDILRHISQNEAATNNVSTQDENHQDQELAGAAASAK